MVRPVSDGEAAITAAAQGRTATVTVQIKNAHAAHTWSFRNDVIPVMSKVGCNSGACHGAAAGKNGFKLTLRGYDPDQDYDTLTRESSARRISLSEPSHSLMLLKPTFAVPAWRRQTFHDQFARISHHFGVDRGRRAAACRHRSPPSPDWKSSPRPLL